MLPDDPRLPNAGVTSPRSRLTSAIRSEEPEGLGAVRAPQRVPRDHHARVRESVRPHRLRGAPAGIDPTRGRGVVPESEVSTRCYCARVTTDVLGPGFESETLALPDDDEGEVVATLVRHRGPASSRRAVLYVHGFTDYFFQRELAERYVAAGLHFYALDLRKYGRSLRPHQTPNFCRDIREYFAELDLAF